MLLIPSFVLLWPWISFPTRLLPRYKWCVCCEDVLVPDDPLLLTIHCCNRFVRVSPRHVMILLIIFKTLFSLPHESAMLKGR